MDENVMSQSYEHGWPLDFPDMSQVSLQEKKNNKVTCVTRGAEHISVTAALQFMSECTL